MAARFAKAKQAPDEIIAACRKAQTDALLIEALAQIRLRRGATLTAPHSQVPHCGQRSTTRSMGWQKRRESKA
jgi:hypothetical protein